MEGTQSPHWTKLQNGKGPLTSALFPPQLERDRAVLEDVAAPTEEEGEAEEGEREAAAEEKAGGQLSWNYAEFRVKYASLAKEVSWELPSPPRGLPLLCVS